MGSSLRVDSSDSYMEGNASYGASMHLSSTSPQYGPSRAAPRGGSAGGTRGGTPHMERRVEYGLQGGPVVTTMQSSGYSAQPENSRYGNMYSGEPKVLLKLLL